jgi:hypothetical protein
MGQDYSHELRPTETVLSDIDHQLGRFGTEMLEIFQTVVRSANEARARPSHSPGRRYARYQAKKRSVRDDAR